MNSQACEAILTLLQPHLDELTDKEREVVTTQIVPLYCLATELSPEKLLQALSVVDLVIPNSAFDHATRYMSTKPQTGDDEHDYVLDETWVFDDYIDVETQAWPILLAGEETKEYKDLLKFVRQASQEAECSYYDVMAVLIESYPYCSLLSKRVEFLLAMAVELSDWVVIGTVANSD